MDVDRYLERIGMRSRPSANLAGLEQLQRAHLSTVPFENLSVCAAAATPSDAEAVRTDLDWSVPKVVTQRRGGWCFELNGAFGALLTALGFSVRYLGAAVLLDGPNRLVDHLTLEVTLERPLLVDVGFGESFTRPLALNTEAPQDGGIAKFGFLPSAEGTTLVKYEVDPNGAQEDGPGVPAAQFRFRRVSLQLADFNEASTRLGSDPALKWSTKPFATRLLDGGQDRVTLLGDRLKLTRYRHDQTPLVQTTPVAAEAWDDTLAEWFDLSPLTVH